MGFQKTGKAEQIGEAMRLMPDQSKLAQATKIENYPSCQRTGMHVIPVGESKCKLCGKEPK